MNNFVHKNLCEFHYKYKHIPMKNKKLINEYEKELLNLMNNIKRKDIKELSKEELEKIPMYWLFDWNSITKTFSDNNKIIELYNKYGIKEQSLYQCLKNNEDKQYYADVHKILPHNELKYYIEKFLVYDKQFIEDIDLCLCDGQMSKMNRFKRMQYFYNNIGNEARTYLIKIITLKHLSKILLNNIDGFTDKFWKDKLKNINLNIDKKS